MLRKMAFEVDGQVGFVKEVIGKKFVWWNDNVYYVEQLYPTITHVSCVFRRSLKDHSSKSREGINIVSVDGHKMMNTFAPKCDGLVGELLNYCENLLDELEMTKSYLELKS